MAGVLQGKLISVSINDNPIRCQMDATLGITQEITENEPCKPTATETTDGAGWTTHTTASRSWTITVTAKTFADVLNGFLDQNDIADLMIAGTSSVNVVFETTRTLDYDHDTIWMYEGVGTLTSFTINAPQDGESTWDFEITGNGAIQKTETPITS